MKGNNLLIMIAFASVALFSACSQEEQADRTALLPDATYPLQIGDMSILAQASDTPDSRMTESDDGNSSLWAWDGTDQIGVQLYPDGDFATYTLNTTPEGAPVLTPDKTLYWRNAEETTVSAWYPTYTGDNGVVDLSNQYTELAYVLKGEGTGRYNSGPVDLKFTHSLAKVRLIFEDEGGARFAEAFGYKACKNVKGEVEPVGEKGWMFMHEVYNSGEDEWSQYLAYELNMVPGKIDPDNFIRLEGASIVEKITGLTELKGGYVYTIKIGLGPERIDLTEYPDGTTLTLDENAIIWGGYDNDTGMPIEKNIQIKIDGSPRVELYDVKLNCDLGPAIHIVSGDPVIKISGENEFKSATNTAVAVAEGAHVLIYGMPGYYSDKIVVSGGASEAGAGAGIGSAVGEKGGSVTIRDLYIVKATGGTSASNAFGGAGIGSAAPGSFGDINIGDGIEYEINGGYGAAAIGMGYQSAGATSRQIGSITLSGTDDLTLTMNPGAGAAAIGFSALPSGMQAVAGPISITTTRPTADFFAGFAVTPWAEAGFELPYFIGKGAYVGGSGTAFYGTDGAAWPGVTFVSGTETITNDDGVAQNGAY